MRKGEILPRKYSDLHLDESVPYAYVGRTKNRQPKKVPLPKLTIEAIKTLKSLKGIPEAIISKMTGHKSRELTRYEHLSPAVRKQTVDLIASELEVVRGLPTGTPEKEWHASTANLLINGGPCGTIFATFSGHPR